MRGLLSFRGCAEIVCGTPIGTKMNLKSVITWRENGYKPRKAAK